jgi:hypothetical protein
MYPVFRPERPWDLSDVNPDTPVNRAALRMLFQQRLVERGSSSADRESQSTFNNGLSLESMHVSEL